MGATAKASSAAARRVGETARGGSTLLICGITIKYVIMTGNLCTLLVCTLLLLVHCSYAHCNKDNYHINNDIFYHLVIITSLVIMVEPTIMIMIT